MAKRTILIGADAPLLTWSQLDPSELRADVFRVPHHGGALDDGGLPHGWSATYLYDTISPQVAVVSVGTNNTHGHPDSETWIRPLVCRPGCRLVCTQVTGRCHSPFDKRNASESERREAIRETRESWLPAPYNGFSHFCEPPWRHYRKNIDAPLARLRADLDEVPCAGATSVLVDEEGNK